MPIRLTKNLLTRSFGYFKKVDSKTLSNAIYNETNISTVTYYIIKLTQTLFPSVRLPEGMVHPMPEKSMKI